MNLPLFKGFDRKFRSLLGLYCERHAYFPEHTATREGDFSGISELSSGFSWGFCDFQEVSGDFEGISDISS